jgi:Zn-dependent protease with chaperone function
MIEYHALLLGLLLGTTVLSTALSVLNVRYGGREMRANADWLEGRLGIDDPGELIDYERATTGLGLLQSWVLLAGLLGLLYTGLLTDAVSALSESGLHPVVQGVVFFLGLIAAQRVAGAPFDLYSTFVIDERFGFNETTPKLWGRDFLVGLAVTAVLAGALLGALLALIEVLPTEWVYDLFALPADARYAGLFVSLLIVYPLLELSSPIVNRLSLSHEREADTFAVEVMGDGEPMVEALAGLARENLANPFPHPWYAAFNHQHPPVPERMQYIQEYAAEDLGGEQSSEPSEASTA